MIRIAVLAVLAISLLAAPGSAEIGHFVPGLLNIRDYFQPPEPGVYGAAYNYYYSTNRRNDDHGDKIRSLISPGPLGTPIEIDVDLDLYALAVPFIWVSEWKVLGARYGALVAPTFANASVEASLSIGRRLGGDADNASFAVGDPFVQPIWLDWSGKHWEVSAAYAFYAAAGKYDTDVLTVPLQGTVRAEDPDNIGYGFWTHQWQAAGAWYPFDHKGTAVTGVATYEYHAEKEDFDVQPGENVTLNWGVSQFIPLTSDQHLLLEIGPAGWNGWQVSADSGSDAIDTKRDRTHAAGGQLGVTYLPWFLAVNFHGFYEYETRNRFQGYSLGLSLAKKF